MKPAELFAKNAKRRLEELKISQGELARRLGVTRPMVSDYLRGQRSPGVTVLQAWAEALGCTVSDLLEGSPAPPVVTRAPSPAEMLMAILERFEIDETRKDICLFALSTDSPERLKAVHDTVKRWLPGGVGVTPDNKKPSLG